MSAATVLCVDLDGSLVRTDLLQEAALLLAMRAPEDLFRLPVWLARGKAFLKGRIAERVAPQAALLPYNEELLAWLVEQRETGRRMVLCTASDRRYAEGVAEHLGLFDEVLASDGATNLAGSRKADVLVERYGRGGFDYVGNARADLPVWEAARRAVVVGDTALRDAAGRVAEVERSFAAQRSGLRAWVKGLRLHQWLKNLLLLLPLLGAHRWADVPAWSLVAAAFVSFGCCASGVYLVNDLFDLENDRRHPRKRLRPLASGRISIPAAMTAAALLFTGAFVLAVKVSPAFTGWLLAYLVLTKMYTLVLKKTALVDCLALAGLYTLRVVAGGAAIDQPVSFWLLAFSLFLFLSLAYVKRYAELVSILAAGGSGARGRGYHTDDRQLLQSFGVASGFASALVLALYLNSDAVLRLYSHPDRLWFTLPILLFWISWMWLRASRGQMHDDPVLFAVKDRASVAAGAAFLVAIWAAH
jgi:4-hydroxybenzoate polyprenyltransferase/phosphoserine phosphatase